MILLFPFGLTADQITFWGFVAIVVAVLLSLWSSIASTLAAKYAKNAPTKAEFKRLEEHAIATLQHLHRQVRREELSPKANRVSISIRSMSPVDDLLLVVIVVRDPTVRLTHVDLLNESGESGYVYGTSETLQIDSKTYNAAIDSESLKRLFASGVQSRNACIRVYMIIEQEEVKRDVPVILANVQMPMDEQHQHRTGWMIQGEI